MRNNFPSMRSCVPPMSMFVLCMRAGQGVGTPEMNSSEVKSNAAAAAAASPSLPAPAAFEGSSFQTVHLGSPGSASKGLSSKEVSQDTSLALGGGKDASLPPLALPLGRESVGFSVDLEAAAMGEGVRDRVHYGPLGDLGGEDDESEVECMDDMW